MLMGNFAIGAYCVGIEMVLKNYYWEVYEFLISMGLWSFLI